MATVDVVVIGAGHAGLAASHELARSGIDHVVLERQRVGESWRSQRWDSFALNTPGALSLLPGDTEGPGAPDAFWRRDVYVSYLEDYARRSGASIQTGVSVTRVEANPGTRRWRIDTDQGESVEARSVVVAAGTQRVPRVPPFAAGLPGDVVQLHALTYRNPASLPSGAVLVVGSAQSGVQIAEDVLDGGRTVYLSTGHTGRIRRRYRGRDSLQRLFASPWFKQTPETLPDPAMLRWAQPQISGIGPLGHSVSLQWLEARGVRLLGRLEASRGGRLTFADDVGVNIAWGDGFSANVTAMMEAGVVANERDAPGIEDDPGDAPHPDPTGVHAPTSLDIADAGISTVIWTTGVAGDPSFLPATCRTPDGHFVHTRGVGPMPGLFYIGLPWMRTRGSGIVAGAAADAAYVTGLIQEQLTAH